MAFNQDLKGEVMERKVENIPLERRTTFEESLRRKRIWHLLGKEKKV